MLIEERRLRPLTGEPIHTQADAAEARATPSVPATSSRSRHSGLPYPDGVALMLLGLMGVLAAAGLLVANVVTYVAETIISDR